ncbi:hypothetical protein GQ53DRAFT_814608 [Thozetella sp. PMI_491]|nr:hypothetical protein GQ53DRAFT_814608 [Thozetella sp. PMI_491]
MTAISQPMLRPGWGESEDENPPRHFPDPILVRPDKYWALHGTFSAGSNPLAELDANSINLIECVDAVRTWEALKIPIICACCMDRDDGRSFLDHFHWKYLHCPSCLNFFVCGECCASTSASVVQQVNSHRAHGPLVPIQTRPFSRPLHDGSELAHLRIFRSVTTADHFFLYFPWFFHCFGNMDAIRNYLRQAFIERATQAMAEPDADRDALESTMSLFDFPVDWFLRAYGGGDWKRFHQALQGMLNEKIHVAQASTRIYMQLQRLQSFVARKEAVYGSGDIPRLGTTAHTRAAAQAFGVFEGFLTYLMPLHMSTVQNQDIDNTMLRRILQTNTYHRAENNDLINEILEADLASAGSSGFTMEGSTSHLSNPFAPEVLRLWPMFKLLFEDDAEFGHLVQGVPSDLTPFLQYALPSWQPMLDKDSRVRECLLKIQYPSLAESVQYLIAPTGSRPTVASDLLECRRQRILGNFDVAVQQLMRLNAEYLDQNLSNTEVILELQLTLLEQGYYRKVMDCSSLVNLVVIRDPGDLQTMSFLLIVITAAYARCFVQGDWEHALDSARVTFQQICYIDPGENHADSIDHILLRVRIELMLHRIVLETYRDLARSLPKERAITRLQAIRHFLTAYCDDPAVAEVAWATFSVELELRKRGVRAQYMELESAHSMTQFIHTPVEILPLVNMFKASIRGQNTVSRILRGRAELLHAGLFVEMGQGRQAAESTQAAEASFASADCTVGALDAQLLHATSRPVVLHSEIVSIYDQLRSRNDVARLRKMRILRPSQPSDADGLEMEWLLHQRAALRDLAKEAGDMVDFHRWNLRRYAADSAAGAALGPAEDILTTDACHSSMLATLASFNLSKAYATLGNYLAASLSAMLHLSLVDIQIDAETHQRAVLNVLRIFSETVAADPARFQDRLAGFSRYWRAFLDDKTMHRWYETGGRCDEIERFVESACFLPLLSGRVERAPNNGIRYHDSGVEEALTRNVDLALDLYETLPTYNAHAIVPKLALAMGSTAAYVGNPELAIRCYWQGIVCCHSGDLYSRAWLWLEAGKLMTTLAEEDPEHWMHVVAPGRSLLDAAFKSFVGMTLSGAVLKGAEAAMYLLRSFVSEARAWKRLLDEELSGVDEVVIRPGDAIVRLAELFARARPLVAVNSVFFQELAEFVSLGSAFDSAFNLVRLAENIYFRETKQFALELGLIMSDIENLQGLQHGTNFWTMVQEFKATVLSYRYGRLVPVGLLEGIRASDEAWELYCQERELLDEGPQFMSDMRLQSHREKMAECPELKPLMRRRRGAIEMSDLNTLVSEAMGRAAPSVIFIDWIHYRGGFIITGYNATKGEICIYQWIQSPQAADVEAWVSEHVRVDSAVLAHQLDSLTVFEPLLGLTAAIHQACSPGDILVFSPSQSLNAIPLHALPYRNADDPEPIIHHHPVVYTPSNRIMKECVQRAMSMNVSEPLRAHFFHSHTVRDDPAAAAAPAIRDMASQLTSRTGMTSSIISGTAVTQAAVAEQMPDADILHFHGHVDGRALEQFLVLQPEASLEASGGSDIATQPAEETPSSTFDNEQAQNQEPTSRFTLQDVFAATIRARLVLLMGCGSGQLVVSQSDDTLGLITAFLAAGATSVVGTLWPLDNNDAVKFSQEFYKTAFEAATTDPRDDGGGACSSQLARSEPGDLLVDIARATQHAINSVRACDRERCQRKNLAARLRCHPRAPYHWASFSLWGSWFCYQPKPNPDMAGNIAEAMEGLGIA